MGWCSVLRFPKLVEIKNPRLIMLFYTLHTFALASLITWVSFQTIWDNYQDIGEFISGNVAVYDGGLDFSLMTGAEVEARIQELQNTVCASAAQINFWRDPLGRRTLTNYTCVQPCLPGIRQQPLPPQQNSSGSGGVRQNCALSTDRYMVKGSAEVFLPTSRVGIAGARATHELLLTADALTLDLGYHFDVPEHARFRSVNFERPLSGAKRDTVTKLRAPDGSVIRTYPPDEKLLLTAREVLEVAGVPDAMDTPRPRDRVGANMRPGSPGLGPIGRVAGVELVVYVECNGNIGTGSAGIQECHIDVRETSRGWVYERVTSPVPGANSPETIYFGIRIRMQGRGQGHYFDFGTLISRLTTFIVIIAMPRALTMFVSTTLLGNLSVIYRQVLHETFKLKSAFAGMSARLLVWNYVFVELADSDSNGRFHLSDDKLNERMRSLLKCRGLSEAEIRCLCSFASEAMISLTDEMSSHKSLLSAVRTDMETFTAEVGLHKRTSSRLPGRVIDSEGFSVACTSTELLGFKAFVELLDCKRKRRFMERLFTPKDVQEVLKAERRLVDKPAEDSCREATIEGADVQHESPAPPEETFVMSAHSHAGTDGTASAGDDAGNQVIVAKTSAHLTVEEERELQKTLPLKMSQLMSEHSSLRERHADIERKVEESGRAAAASRELLEEVQGELRSQLDQLRRQHARDVEELRRSLRELQELQDRRPLPGAPRAAGPAAAGAPGRSGAASSAGAARRASASGGPRRGAAARPVPAPREAPTAPVPCFAPPVVDLPSLTAALQDASRDLGVEGTPGASTAEGDLRRRSDKMISWLHGIAEEFGPAPLYPHSDVWVPLEGSAVSLGLSVSVRSDTQDDSGSRRTIPAGAIGSVSAIDENQAIGIHFQDLGYSPSFNGARLSSSSDAPLHERKTFAAIHSQLSRLLDDIESWRTEAAV